MDHLVEAVPTGRGDETVESALRHLRAGRWDTLNYIYVLDDERRLVGIVSVRELLAARNEQPVRELMARDLMVVHPHDDQERAGILAIQHGIKAVPIVRPGSGEFLGVVGSDQVLKILHEEHTEDFLRLSGVQRDHPVTDMLHASAARLAGLRLPWLVVGFGGGVVATLVSGFFEATISQQIFLAFFIPMVVYMSDAVGTQTETIYIRSLTLKQSALLRYAVRELAVGLMIAAVIATLIYLFAAVWTGSAALAFAVAAAMFINVAIAPLVALVVPTLLYWKKKDPALGSGPFTTIIQDVISLLVYFSVTTWLLF
jgi:magnesium transporter